MKIFVYGTLKRGYGNNHLLNKATFLKEDTTLDDRFDMTTVGFPKVFEGGSFKVKGELFEVPEEDVPNVDSLEGHPNWYERKEVALSSGDIAWMYIMPEESSGGYPVEPIEGVLEWKR